MIDRLYEWAKKQDADHGDDSRSTAALVESWGTLKLVLIAATLPLWAPIISLVALGQHRVAKFRSTTYGEQLHRLAEGRHPIPPANVTTNLEVDGPVVVVSDMHRCIGGALDWPRLQNNVQLVDSVLSYYADEEATLIENGDIEDFWMVGSTHVGMVYDIVRLVGGAAATFGYDFIRNRNYTTQLRNIVSNYPSTYELIAQRFATNGRFLRTVGNHDDPLAIPEVGNVYNELTGAQEVCDYVALRRNGSLVGVVTHGHHTDAWNAPTTDFIGKLSTWASCALGDTSWAATPNALPRPEHTQRLFSGAVRNGLIAVSDLLGASRNYDSLDEELLFAGITASNAKLAASNAEASITEAAPGPWLIFGHTHAPVRSPTAKNGAVWEKYANSGSGVGHELLTALEINPAGDDIDVHLVAWIPTPDGDDPTYTDASGVSVTRIEFASLDGYLIAAAHENQLATY